MAFSKNLRDLRIARGMSQQQLADIIDVKQPTVAQYESGRRQPTICISIRIAKVLGTTVEALVPEALINFDDD